MTDAFNAIQAQLENCTSDEKELLFRQLRERVILHPIENDFGVEAEVILEAIHRGSDLTKRMLRGVIADAAFHIYEVPKIAQYGWTDIKLDGNYSYDHKLKDNTGEVTVQVKLQRSEGEKVQRKAVITDGRKYRGLPDNHYMVEVQRTRTGKTKGKAAVDGEAAIAAAETRPYDFDAFDILAVSLWPSTGDWTRFRYTVTRWLRSHPDYPQNSKIATYQPVAMAPNNQWTDDFNEVTQWLRSNRANSVMPTAAPPDLFTH
jgi:hypothetical protein